MPHRGTISVALCASAEKEIGHQTGATPVATTHPRQPRHNQNKTSRHCKHATSWHHTSSPVRQRREKEIQHQTGATSVATTE